MTADRGRAGEPARPPRAALQPRPWLERIEPYRPGLPAASGDGSLAANESPFGPSARVVAAITGAARRAHRYPDPLAGPLRAELAARHGVGSDQILVGNGSDELIFLLAWAYLAQQGHAVCADPPYRIDEISAHLVGARLTRVPLRDWAHDLDAMARVAADIVYLVNPHNPTGTVRGRAEIEQFVQASPAGLIVVDEAYVEFTDDPDATTCLPLVASGRVAVLRTFSKIYGLAGLRVGYLIAEPGIVAILRKIRAPFSVGALAQAGALAALGDPGHAAQVRARIRQGRAELARLFERAGYPVIPSQANFILVLAPDEHALVSRLAERGITVRPGSTLGLPGTVRVSVPSPRGLRLLDRALSTTPGRSPAESGRPTATGSP
jgi:histidinol-phosphate aminotransferase